MRSWTDSVLGVAGAAADVTLGAAKMMLPKPGQRAALEKTGAVLRRLRETAGMSVAEVGSAIDLKDPTLLELVENGKVALPFEIILRLASVLGRNDPISFVMRFTRSYNPDVWKTLESLGIGRLAVQAGREREFANLYRASDAARRLSDEEFAEVLKFTQAAFAMAVAFRAGRAARPDPPPEDRRGNHRQHEPGVAALRVPHAVIGDAELARLLSGAEERVRRGVPQRMAGARHDDGAGAQSQESHRDAERRGSQHVLGHLGHGLREVRIDDRHREMPQAERDARPDDRVRGRESGTLATSPQHAAEEAVLRHQRQREGHEEIQREPPGGRRAREVREVERVRRDRAQRDQPDDARHISKRDAVRGAVAEREPDLAPRQALARPDDDEHGREPQVVEDALTGPHRQQRRPGDRADAADNGPQPRARGVRHGSPSLESDRVRRVCHPAGDEDAIRRFRR